MDNYKAISLSVKIQRKITCMIMEEITDSYQNDDDYRNFELDYEYIKQVVLYNMLRSSVAKASSPLTSPSNCESPRVGVSLN